jgi:hypothetical protein
MDGTDDILDAYLGLDEVTVCAKGLAACSLVFAT